MPTLSKTGEGRPVVIILNLPDAQGVEGRRIQEFAQTAMADWNARPERIAAELEEEAQDDLMYDPFRTRGKIRVRLHRGEKLLPVITEDDLA